MYILNHNRNYSLFLGLLMCSLVSFGQTKKPLTLDDYAQWNKITNTAISPNGNWVTYSYVPNEGDATLHIKKTEGDTLRTAINGKQVAFSANSKWVAYLVNPTKKAAEKLKEAKKPILSDLQLLNLESNKVAEVKNVKGYHFSKTSQFIAIQKNPMDKKADHKGSDVLLKDLNKDITLNIGNVANYAFNKEGTLFSYVVDANEDDGNGLFLIDLNTLRTYPLHTGKFTYAQMTWNKKGDRLAALFGTKIDTLIERENKLYYTSNLSSGMATAITPNIYAPEGDSNFSKQLTISNYGKLTLNSA